jgi:hypothetical protein
MAGPLSRAAHRLHRLLLPRAGSGKEHLMDRVWRNWWESFHVVCDPLMDDIGLEELDCAHMKNFKKMNLTLSGRFCPGKGTKGPSWAFSVPSIYFPEGPSIMTGCLPCIYLSPLLDPKLLAHLRIPSVQQVFVEWRIYSAGTMTRHCCLVPVTRPRRRWPSLSLRGQSLYCLPSWDGRTHSGPS